MIAFGTIHTLKTISRICKLQLQERNSWLQRMVSWLQGQSVKPISMLNYHACILWRGIMQPLLRRGIMQPHGGKQDILENVALGACSREKHYLDHNMEHHNYELWVQTEDVCRKRLSLLWEWALWLKEMTAQVQNGSQKCTRCVFHGQTHLFQLYSALHIKESYNSWKK